MRVMQAGAALLGLSLSLSVAVAQDAKQPSGAPPAPPKGLPSPARLPKQVVRGALFNSDDEFLRWAGSYYAAPMPDVLPAAFEYFLRSPLSRDEVKRVELAAFFGAALRRAPELTIALRDVAVAARTYDALFALVNTLWLADGPEFRSTLRDLAETEPDARVKEFITKRAQAVSPLADGKAIDTISNMELRWWQFAATGDVEIPKAIATIVLTQYETSPEAAIFQGAAANSLRARGHIPQVREGLRQAIEASPPSPLRDDAQALLDEMERAGAPAKAPPAPPAPPESPAGNGERKGDGATGGR